MPNIIDVIEEKQKPGDIANWWGKQNPRDWTRPLDEEEINYMEVFTSSEIPAPLRIGRGIATVANLAPEQRERSKQLFGDKPDTLALFVNYLADRGASSRIMCIRTQLRFNTRLACIDSAAMLFLLCSLPSGYTNCLPGKSSEQEIKFQD